MSYQYTFDIHLGPIYAGLTLAAQLVDTAGDDVGSEITTGFAEISNGDYLLTATIPDDHQGGVLIYEDGTPGTVLAVGSINPASGGLTAQETANAVHNLAPEGTAAEGSIGDKLDDMPATILTTAVAAYAGTPGTFGYLLSLLAGLDFTQVNLVASSNAGEITIKRSVDLVAVISGLTIPADWTECYWTVKRSTDDPDADALVQILVSNPGDPGDGAQVLAGEAVADGSDGSLVVNQAGGTVAIALGNASTDLLDEAVELVWGAKFHYPAGKVEPGAGTATITTAVTRA